MLHKILNENETRVVKDNGGSYIVRKTEANVLLDNVWQKSDFSLAPANASDKCKLKASKCPGKFGISDGANGEHILGYKVNGHQLKMSPRKLTLWNGFNNSHVDLFDANTSGFNAQTGEFENYYPGINLKYIREAGQMGQSLVVNFPSAFQHHYALGDDPAWELAYWTEIEHPYTLAFLFQNGVYVDAPDETIKSGTWDETRDLDVDSFLIYRRYWEKGRDLLYFPQQTIREAETQPSMDKPGKMVITKEAIREKMRLVKRGGKTYLVESVPMSFVRDWNFVESPLPLNYTTLSGGLAADTSYTTETVLIDAAVTLGTYNLTISGTAVIKNNNGAKYIQVNSTGTLIITGTSARKVYLTSANDDTVGEAIAGSTGVPSTADVRAHIYITSTSSTITANYATFRYSGASVSNAHITFGVNSAQMPTFNDCQFEWGGPLGTIGRASTYTGTAVTLTRCNFINPGNYCAQADNVYVTHMKVYGAVFNIITVLNGTDSYIRNFFGQGAANANMIVLAAGVLTVTNFESYGKNGSASTGAIVATGGTLTLKYSIIMGNRNGVWANGGTINHTYNLVHGNTANFVGTVQDATESIANPEYVWPVNSCVPGLRTGSWGLSQTTTDKVNDAGYEYLVGTYKDENKTLLVATDNIPLGFCDWDDRSIASQIQINAYLAGVKTIKFATTETVTIDGTVTSQSDLTGASFVVTINKLSDDSVASTLYSSSATTSAGVAKTFSSIAGASLTGSSLTNNTDYYVKAVLSGGLQGAYSNTMKSVTFRVEDPSVSAAPTPAPVQLTATNQGTGGAISFVFTIPTASYDHLVIYRKGATSAFTTAVASITGAAVSITATGLTNNVPYEFIGVAYDSTGVRSQPSNVLWAMATSSGGTSIQDQLWNLIKAEVDSSISGISFIEKTNVKRTNKNQIYAAIKATTQEKIARTNTTRRDRFSFQIGLMVWKATFELRSEAATSILDQIKALLDKKQYGIYGGSHWNTETEIGPIDPDDFGNENLRQLETGITINCEVEITQ